MLIRIGLASGMRFHSVTEKLRPNDSRFATRAKRRNVSICSVGTQTRVWVPTQTGRQPHSPRHRPPAAQRPYAAQREKLPLVPLQALIKRRPSLDLSPSLQPVLPTVVFCEY